MDLKTALDVLPETKHNVLVSLSGGMDSSIAAMLLCHKYGPDRVHALSYNYGQKQKIELEKASKIAAILGIKHKIFDLSILGEIGKGFSANLDTDINMPTIKEVLGDPRPKTYVPNRNMIIMSLAAAYAEVENIDTIIMGLQVHDEYSYHDTTQRFVNKVNDVLSENRVIQIKIIAPFSQLSKYDEIQICKKLGLIDMLAYTMTCYNPNELGQSCGKCPSCSERIANFAKAGIVDPVPYSIDIPWDKLIK